MKNDFFGDHLHRRRNIFMSFFNGFVALTVEDDGRGFDSGRRDHARSLGLSGMSERAQMIGGTFECESRPGKGTRVTVRLNLPTATAP